MTGSARVLPWLWGAIGILALVGIWELYKWLGPEDGVVIGAVEGETGSGVRLLPRTHDRAMPHVWTMFGRLLEPTGGGDTPLLVWSVALAAVTTLGIPALGWAIGLVVGLVLALAMQSARIVEWGLLPWVIVSQTVPLIAFAPVVNSMASQAGLPQWVAVAVIASYLSFFPVAIGALRGLKSPHADQLDLMRSYAAGRGATLRRLRFPSSVPHLLPALRLAAANAVVGAVVAEVSIGMRGGIGRMIIQFAGQASSDPAIPWSATFGAVALGLIAAGAVAFLAYTMRNYRRGEVAA